jgi:hypothetical protein
MNIFNTLLRNFSINYIIKVEGVVILTIIFFVLYIFYSLNLFKKS